MRYIITIILFISLCVDTFSQNFVWVTGEETNYEMNPAMANYTASTAPDGTIWFGGMKELVQFYQEAMGNLFLEQLDASGNQLQYHEITGSALLEDIETDSSGYVYFIGQYIGDLQFWDGYELPFSGPFINSFFAKISPEGIVEWAKNLSELNPDAVAGDILVHGNRVFVAHSEWTESNITEYDQDGNAIWTINQGNVGIISSIAMDNDGNIYATGSCPQPGTTFGGVSYPPPFTYNMYLVKYNPEGTPEWVRFVEDVTFNLPDIRIDNEQNIIWAGALDLETEFDTLTLLGPTWVYDLFVTKFDPQGHVQWGIEVPQVITGDASVAKLETIALLPDNSVAFGGVTRGVIDWGNGVISDAGGIFDVQMILVIHPDGQINWVKTGGGTGFAGAMSIDADSQGNLYMAGEGHGTIQFDTCSFTGQSFYYPYLVKLNAETETGVHDPGIARDLIVYPNPSAGIINISFPAENIRQIRIYNDMGKTVFTSQGSNILDISGLPVGIYYVNIITNQAESLHGKIIKVL
jgi:hypothetical protein